jgi:copper(I)-binding protein
MTSVTRLCASLLLAATLVTLGGCGGGQSQQDATPSEPSLPEDELALENIWVRPVEPGGNTALYMSLANGQSAADTLLSVDAPIIDSVAIHSTVDTAETTMMKHVGPLPIPANTRVPLEPGGTHVMLMGVTQPLRDGESIVLNVDFAQAGLRRVRAAITNTPPSAAQ